ncbi:helix-turn-helix domain-containing protein [Xylanibacter muris]
MMLKKQILNTDFRKAQDVLANADFIEDDIILFDKMDATIAAREPRRMTFILVALCMKGHAEFAVDTQMREVGENDVIVISERHVVDNFKASEDLECLCMIISTRFFYDIVKNVSDMSTLFLFSRNHPVTELSVSEVDLFRKYFFLLKEKTAERENRFRRDVVKTLVLAMFYDLSNIIYRINVCSERKQSRADVIFTDFIRLVEGNFKEQRRVGWYAGQMSITPKYLSEAVKQISRRTPNEWIDSYVTLELRVQLKNSAKSIKEIAMDMHFPNQSFLGKYFKEHVGMSPSEYRQS